MCTKVRELYSCTHSQILPSEKNILCESKWESGVCKLKDGEMAVRILEKDYVCGDCARRDSEWVDVNVGGKGGSEDVDVKKGEGVIRKLGEEKGKGCVVM